MLRQATLARWPWAAQARPVPWPFAAAAAARLSPPVRHSSTLESRPRHQPHRRKQKIERENVGGTSNNNIPPVPALGPHGQPPEGPQETGKGNRVQQAQNKTASSTSSLKWELPKDRLALQMPGLVRQAEVTGQRLDYLVSRFANWDVKFRSIWARLEGERLGKPLPVTGSVRTVLSELLRHETVADMRSHLATKPRSSRWANWMPIMLATMDHHPDRAAQVLEATFKDGCAPHWAVSDVLCFLVKWSSQLPAPDRKKQQAALPGLVLYLLRNSRPKSLCFQQWVLGQVISVCDARTAAELCSALEAYSHRLHFNTKLKLADRLAKDRRYTLLALRLLESVILDDGLSANDRRCAALATLLFKLPQTTWGTGRAPPVEINLIAESYERLVGLGFSPNAITSTTLIHSLCSADQLDTAFKIYDVMRGQWTDDRVFFPLVQAARRSGSLEAIIRVFQHAPSSVLQHRRIWDNLIHAIHVAAKKEAKFKGYKYNHGNPAFRSMLQVYCKFFDLAPLQRLIPWDLHRYLEEPDRNSGSDNWDFKVKLDLFIDKLPVLPTGRAMNPGTITLTTMLLGYLRTFPKAIRAIEFYSHFRNLLRDRDTTAIRLLRDTTLPYDVVLKSLAEHAGTLRVMTDIVKTMLADAAKSAAARKQAAGRVAVAAAVPSNSKPRAAPEAAVSPENDASPEEKSRDQNEQDGAAVSSRSKPAEPTLKPLYHPPPSVCTWSILLYAFSRERGPRNAARILGLMRANNIEPNRATWNTVANSYGRVQDKKRVSGALHMLEKTGFHPDVHTIRAVAQLRGYEDVLDQMETRMEQRGEAHMQMVAELAKPPITLIEKWNAERARREAEALSGVPEGQEQQQQQQQLEQEVVGEDAGAKQTVADAELEASLKELEDAHEAMLRAAEAAARENPVSKTVPAAVRAAKKRSARGVSAEPDSEEIAAYMEMYDELVFEQMKEELTGFNTKGGEKAREAVDTEQDSARAGAEMAQQAPQDTASEAISQSVEEPQKAGRDSVGEEVREKPQETVLSSGEEAAEAVEAVRSEPQHTEEDNASRSVQEEPHEPQRPEAEEPSLYTEESQETEQASVSEHIKEEPQEFEDTGTEKSSDSHTPDSGARPFEPPTDADSKENRKGTTPPPPTKE